MTALNKPYVIVTTIWSKMETDIQTGNVLSFPYPQQEETHFVMAENLGDACIQVQKTLLKRKNQREVWFGVCGDDDISRNIKLCKEPVLVKACFLENGYGVKPKAKPKAKPTEDIGANQRLQVREILNKQGLAPLGFFTHNVKTKGYKIKLWGLHSNKDILSKIEKQVEKIEGFVCCQHLTKPAYPGMPALSSLVLWFKKE